jgi:hypothetical protein
MSVPSHRAHLHALFLELAALLAHVQLQQGHQRGHLALGAVPVLAAEGKEREHLHPRVARGLDGGAHGRHPGAVAELARAPALAGPAAVAIHDDGHVPRDRPVQPDLLEELLARHSGKMSTRRRFVKASGLRI